jgi:acyl carrier protein
MPSATITQQVRSFLAENYFLGQDYNFEDSDSFLENGIIDSTGILQLVAFLEETYGITVEEGELRPENLDSINNISSYLSRKRKGAQQEAHGPATREIAQRGNG